MLKDSILPLARNEINLTIRLANTTDVDSIWDLYLKTNYLYPEKLVGMGDNGKSAKENLKKLLSLDDKTFRICICEDKVGNLLAACSHGLFSDVNDWVMHMTSNNNLPALIKVFKSLRQITLSSSAQWISWTFRPENRSISRLFTSALKAQNSNEIENEIYDYYHINAQNLEIFSKTSTTSLIRQAKEVDRIYVINNLKNLSDKNALSGFGEFDNGFSIKKVREKLQAVSLIRERNAWVVERNNKISGIAVADVSPDWWNTSNLSTGIRLFMLQEDDSALKSLISISTNWLKQFPIQCWTVLASPREIMLKEFLATYGVFSKKKYQRFSMRKSLTNKIYDLYDNFLMRFHGENNEYLHNGIRK